MKPLLQALLLADYVYQDKNTGKNVIAGTFNRYLVATRKIGGHGGEGEQTAIIPAHAVQQAGTPYAYVSLTEVRGKTPLQLRLVELNTNEVCFQTSEFAVECDDPIRTVELVLPLPKLPSQPGSYALELLSNNELIGSHRVQVQQVELKE